MGESGRALAWSLAGFSAGVLVAAAAPSWRGGGLVAMSILLLGIRAWRDAASRRALLSTGLALLSGFGLALLQIERQAARAWPEHRAGETVALTGSIEGLPLARNGRVGLSLRVIEGPAHLRRVELTWFRADAWPRPGERWRVEARLSPPRGLSNPGGYDRGRALFARRVDAVGEVVDATRIAPGGPGSALARLRQDASDWLQAQVPDLRAAALLRALTVGDRSGIESELAEDLRATGTAHLLAISGLHVGLVAGVGALFATLLFTPTRLRILWPDRRRHALVGGLVAAGVYAMLAGFSLPTQRAILMLVVGLGAVLLRRPVAPGRALLVALAAVLLVDPLAPLSLGFWLSFAAVAVLIWAFAGRVGRPGRSGRGLVGLVRAQLVLALGLLPLNLGLFQAWAPAALPANLVVIPLVGFVVLPLGLLAVGSYALGLPLAAAARGAGAAMEWGLAAIDRIGVALPAESIAWQPSAVSIALGFVGALWLLAPRGWPVRGLGALMMLPLLAARPAGPGPGEFDLHVLDVGDGQAVAIRTQSSTMLYGLGPGDGGRSSRLPGTVIPSLRALGAAPIERVVVPGRARGQAGGLGEARRRWPDAEIIGRHPEIEQSCRAGEGWTFDGVTVDVLHPAAGLPDLGGDDDCVLRVVSSSGRVLLTGRIGASVLDRLRGRIGPMDAVLVPRQGHRDLQHAAWWDELDPAFALVSVDAVNRWGLPHDEARNVLEQRNIPLFSTADCGAITVEFRRAAAPALRVEAHRAPRPWRPADRCQDPRSERADAPGLGYDAAFGPGTVRPRSSD